MISSEAVVMSLTLLAASVTRWVMWTRVRWTEQAWVTWGPWMVPGLISVRCRQARSLRVEGVLFQVVDPRNASLRLVGGQRFGGGHASLQPQNQLPFLFRSWMVRRQVTVPRSNPPDAEADHPWPQKLARRGNELSMF